MRREPSEALCGEYGLDSPALRTCMNKNGHSDDAEADDFVRYRLILD